MIFSHDYIIVGSGSASILATAPPPCSGEML